MEPEKEFHVGDRVIRFNMCRGTVVWANGKYIGVCWDNSGETYGYSHSHDGIEHLSPLQQLAEQAE
jgi:hypothetical protein